MAKNQQQIAADLGISRATVSYVLAGKAKEKRIGEEIANRILEAAGKANYRPHAMARSLSDRRTRQVGVLMRNAADRPFDNPPVLEFMVGINLYLESLSYVPVFVRVGDLSAEGEPPSRVFSERLIDGLIAIGNFEEPLVKRIKSLSPHCVWLDSSVYTDQRCIRRDELEVGRQAARMAIEAGYREIVWCGYRKDRAIVNGEHYSRVEREQGVREIAAEAGVSVRAFQVPKRFDVASQQAFTPLMRPHVAWIASGSFTAERMGHSGAALGLRPGLDFGLVSCDDWEGVRLAWPELSRVTFDRLGFGTAAAQMLIEMLNNPKAESASRRIGSEVHRGATLIGPGFHDQDSSVRYASLLERVDEVSHAQQTDSKADQSSSRQKGR